VAQREVLSTTVPSLDDVLIRYAGGLSPEDGSIRDSWSVRCRHTPLGLYRDLDRAISRALAEATRLQVRAWMYERDSTVAVRL